MKKKIFAFFICLSMVMMLIPAIPAASTTVLAAETEHIHCDCGIEHKEIGDHNIDTQTNFSTKLYMEDGKLMKGGQEWVKTKVAITQYYSNDVYALESGSYYLDSDIELYTYNQDYYKSNVLFINGDVKICLNGHNITLNKSESSVINILKGNTLTITDCKGGGNISHKGSYSGGHGIVVNGILNMYGGIISNNRTFGISNNISDSANNGGGVFIESDSKMNMYGGLITNNNAVSGKDQTTGAAVEGYGGGVYICKDGEFTMYGGEISGNNANLGAGGVSNHGTMTVSGAAKIFENTAGDTIASNAYMAEDNPLIISGTLTGKIGIGKQDATVGTIVATGADSDTNYSQIIVSDDSQYDIQNENNNIVLVAHTHIWGTWQHDDTQHWQVCEICSKDAEHTDHTWDNGVITQQPTTTAKGEKTFTCDICKAIKTEDIDKLPPVNYEIVDGANSSWVQNSDGTLTFRANGDLSKFTGVKVDNILLDSDKFTSVSGSTVITLKNDYLNTLSVGKHELTIVYNDGECSTEFEIKAADNNDTPIITNPDNKQNEDNEPEEQNPAAEEIPSPQTGYENNLALWLSLLLISSTAIITVIVNKKEKYYR